MTELLREWVMGIIAGAALCASAQYLVPEGAVKKVTRFVCGVVLCLLMILPLTKVDKDRFSLHEEEYRSAVREITENDQKTEQELLRSYIEEELSAYIWDEAIRLGASPVSVTVSCVRKDDTWMPWSAEICLCAGEEQKNRLLSQLKSELGIGEERVLWRDGNGESKRISAEE